MNRINSPKEKLVINPSLLHLVLADTFNDLSNIKKRSKNLGILPRSLNNRLECFIQDLDLNLFPAIQTSFYVYECCETLHMALQGISADKEGLGFFIQDLVFITENFCSILQTELVRFRLEVIDQDMCKYFHCDFNNLRLMCTYRGKGTIWTPNDNVNRIRLGCKNNDEILIDPSLVHQIQPFWIGLFKGEVFMNNAGNGIVHRSPSFNGKKRILLRLDA